MLFCNFHFFLQIPRGIHPKDVGLECTMWSILPAAEARAGTRMMKLLAYVEAFIKSFLVKEICGIDQLVSCQSKIISKPLLEASDRDKRVKLKDKMDVIVDYNGIPMHGRIAKLNHKERGPNTAAAQQTEMRRTHRREASELDAAWVSESRSLIRSVKQAKAAQLREEARTAARVERTNAGARPAAITPMDTAGGHEADVIDDNHPALLATDRTWPPEVQQHITAYETAKTRYDLALASMKERHTSEEKNAAAAVAAAAVDKIASIQVNDQRTITVLQFLFSSSSRSTALFYQLD